MAACVDGILIRKICHQPFVNQEFRYSGKKVVSLASRYFDRLNHVPFLCVLAMTAISHWERNVLPCGESSDTLAQKLEISPQTRPNMAGGNVSGPGW